MPVWLLGKLMQLEAGSPGQGRNCSAGWEGEEGSQATATDGNVAERPDVSAGFGRAE